jgi:hypothetical protein
LQFNLYVKLILLNLSNRLQALRSTLLDLVSLLLDPLELALKLV